MDLELDKIEEHYDLCEAEPNTPAFTHKGHFEFEVPGPGEMEFLGVAAASVPEDPEMIEEEAVAEDIPTAPPSNRPGSPATSVESRKWYSFSNCCKRKQQTGSKRKPPVKIGEFAATAICGNDITSSVFYVAGITAFHSGFWAPICLVLASGIFLYVFRYIYAEVITALPVNGGTYTVLMNTTTKSFACWAVCFSLISYVATAVVSADVAITYVQSLIPQIENVWGTFVLLLLFAILNLFGLRESANVSSAIFFFHLTVMVILILDVFIWACEDGFSLLAKNYDERNDLMIIGGTAISKPGMPIALLYGFSSALLGITGFETSANFVEEQAKGVYTKTVRNMWFIVAFLNPVLSILSLSVLPIEQVMGYPLIDGEPDNNNLLIQMARHDWVAKLVSVDAFFVLSGAVLTSYVGIIGLVRRLALDRCLPEYLLGTNRLFGTPHRIIFSFFIICASLYYITNRNVLTLANVYTIAFLSVMTLFALGNLMLKYNRSRLRRTVRAPVIYCVIGIFGTITGIVGNILLNVDVIQYFVAYYFVTLAVVFLTFNRRRILKIALHLLLLKYEKDVKQMERLHLSEMKGWRGRLVRYLVSWQQHFGQQPMVYFIKDRNIRLMTKVILYLLDNEQTNNIKFVHIFHPDFRPARSRMVYGSFTPATSMLRIPEDVENGNGVGGGTPAGSPNLLSRQKHRRRSVGIFRVPPKHAEPIMEHSVSRTTFVLDVDEVWKNFTESSTDPDPEPAPTVPQVTITVENERTPPRARASGSGAQPPRNQGPGRSLSPSIEHSINRMGSSIGESVDFREAVEDTHPEVEGMREDLEVLQDIFVTMKLDLVGVCTDAPFDGRLVRKIEQKLNIPPHLMFISCPGERFPQNIAELGGVRLITATA